jgi:putative hydrolase
VELNVLDTEGGVDLPGDFISPLDFVLAGIHEEAYQPWLNNAHSPETDTQAMLAILANPLVDGVSHPDNKTFPVDYEAVVMQAVKYGKVMEMNNGSWKSRPGSEANCRTIAALCKKHNCLVSVGSDAHYWQYVGQFSKAIQVMKDAGIAEEQVVNSSMERWTEFITRRKRERLAAVPAHQF